MVMTPQETLSMCNADELPDRDAKRVQALANAVNVNGGRYASWRRGASR
jgi:hypothetical protein